MSALGVFGSNVVRASTASPTSAIASPVDTFNVGAPADSSAVLRARGAIEITTSGNHTYRMNTTCADRKLHGCYAIVTVNQGSSATNLLGGKNTTRATRSLTFLIGFTQKNPFGVWQYTETLKASDWWNGSSAGTYWFHPGHSLGQCWTEVNPQANSFWDGGAWAYTNWADDTEYYSFGPYNYTMFTWLRIWVQPNGHSWFGAGN